MKNSYEEELKQIDKEIGEKEEKLEQAYLDRREIQGELSQCQFYRKGLEEKTNQLKKTLDSYNKKKKNWILTVLYIFVVIGIVAFMWMLPGDLVLAKAIGSLICLVGATYEILEYYLIPILKIPVLNHDLISDINEIDEIETRSKVLEEKVLPFEEIIFQTKKDLCQLEKRRELLKEQEQLLYRQLTQELLQDKDIVLDPNTPVAEQVEKCKRLFLTWRY